MSPILGDSDICNLFHYCRNSTNFIPFGLTAITNFGVPISIYLNVIAKGVYKQMIMNPRVHKKLMTTPISCKYCIC